MTASFRSVLVLLASAALAACAGQAARPNVDDIAASLPDRFTDVWPVSEERLDVEWWRAFNDPALDALVESGLAGNTDLALAAARLREARAVFGQARSARLPDVGVFVGAARQRGLVAGQPDTVIGESGSYGLSVAYEVDLWGRIAAQSEAARQRYLAQGYTLAATRLVVAAELVRGYFTVQALAANTAIIADNLELLEESLALSERRFEQGLIADLDLQRARAERDDSRALFVDSARQLAAARRALLVLAGELPSQAVDAELVVLPFPSNQAAPAPVPLGLPSSLLERRPDIRSAEALLAAADADVTAARRAFLPGLTLTGSGGQASVGLGNLFSDGLDIWSISAELVATLFDGGRRRAAVEANRARQEQMLIGYADVVRNAFREVLDALDAYRAEAAVYQARSNQVEALTRAVFLAERRYDEGYADFLSVIDARRQLLQARLAVVRARQASQAAHVDLALALGGGWSPEAEPL